MPANARTDKHPDPRAINPRYQGLRLSDAVRILTRPKNPEARKALDRIQGGGVRRFRANPSPIADT